MSRTGSGICVSSAVEQLVDRLLPLRVAVERRKRRAADHRRVVAVELVLVEELAHLHLDQVQHLRVVDRVALVEEHDDVVQADLAGQQHVLARLRHDRVERRHDQDRAVHLRRARDHVLDVVGVPRAIDVRVVALVVSYSTCATAIVTVFVSSRTVPPLAMSL